MTSSSAEPMTWQEELASLVHDSGIRFPVGDLPPAPPDLSGMIYGDEEGDESREESFHEQVKGFLRASGEMAVELGRGCRDIAIQSLDGAEDWYVVRRLRGPSKALGKKMEFLNDYLPEDRDPVHSWMVVISVLMVAIAVLGVNTSSSQQQVPIEVPKKLNIHPPTASHILLPDGRRMSYLEQGVSAEVSRFSLIAPHSFLSSRLAGIPGVKASLLEEFGVRLVTYDLPGFGESDPHSIRDLNSSAFDMLHLADSVGVSDKFWVLGYSSGGMHAWAALHYIPDRIAGAAMFAPIVNPYDSSMTKEERHKTWQKWTAKKRLMYVLARRFPSLLPFFYRRSFLSGIQGRPEKWLSLSLGKKDKTTVEEQGFIEHWVRDVEESVRQGDAKPFVEEAVLQVSNWGFNLADLQVQKKDDGGGILFWLKSYFSPVEREWTGFLGPIHIWQGMDDRVMPPSMTEFVRRVVPGATVHRLLDEGHFSYFCFCDDCHRQVFSTLFGVPQGPISISTDTEINPTPTPTTSEVVSTEEETAPVNFTED